MDLGSVFTFLNVSRWAQVFLLMVFHDVDLLNIVCLCIVLFDYMTVDAIVRTIKWFSLRLVRADVRLCCLHCKM